jgi:uncharacterized protein (TIGR02246 family)
MFERYSERARRVIFFARYEASQYGSPYIETEHLLLGLFREDHALARKFLSERGGAQSLRDEIETQITRRERISTSVEVPLSAECKRILKMAAEEAERLGSKSVGTEHLLLGTLREQDSLAARLLRERGLTVDQLRTDLNRPPAPQEEKVAEEIISVFKFAQSWSAGNAEEFATMFASDGQFVDPHGNLSIGPERIAEAAKFVFSTPGWARSEAKIEDVQLVGSKAIMINLAWEAAEETDTPNPGCVRMTVIMTRKREGLREAWSITRVQATGFQAQSRSAAG